MTVRDVLKMGHPLLWQKAEPVEHIGTKEVDEIIEDMFDTMHAYKGIGIAAPQIGISKRILIFGFESSPRYPNEKPVPTTVLINPEITILTDEQVQGWEGCLSVPGLRGVVSRYTALSYTGFDPQGNRISREATGFHARMVQHENDHLDGILYPQRIKDLRLLGFEDMVWDQVVNAEIPEV